MVLKNDSFFENIIDIYSGLFFTREFTLSVLLTQFVERMFTQSRQLKYSTEGGITAARFLNTNIHR